MSSTMRGWLVKESGNSALQRISLNKQKRFFVIHDDCVMRYYKKEGEDKDDACGQINLLNLEYVRLITGTHNNRYFELKERHSERIPYVFECNSAAEAQAWIHHINESRERSSDPNSTSTPPSSDKLHSSPSTPSTPISHRQSATWKSPSHVSSRGEDDVVLEGYLCKRSRGRSLLSAAAGSNRWAERRFCLYYPEQTVVYYDGATYKGEYPIDQHTTVRHLPASEEDTGRQHVFELSNAVTGDSLRCSADSEWRAVKWVGVVAAMIEGSYIPDAVIPSTGSSKATIERIVTTPAAQARLAAFMARSPICADCNHPSPTWASLTHGVLICTACSGVHRSLGVNVSFIQSLTLDAWSDGSVETLCSKGTNETANAELEYHVPVSMRKPTSRSGRDLRAQYITAKYHGAFGRLAPAGPPIDSEVDSIPAPERAPQAPTYSTDDSCNDKSIGEQEFIGVLIIHLGCCCDLERADFIGKSDPYVVLTTGHQSVKSKAMTNTLNPHYNETLLLSWDGITPLVIQVFDHDKFKKHDPIGSASIDLASKIEQLGGGKVSVVNMPLEKVSRGTITLEVEFNRL